jgi:hypothetical protein
MIISVGDQQVSTLEGKGTVSFDEFLFFFNLPPLSAYLGDHPLY